jgi:hypothetical protein
MKTNAFKFFLVVVLMSFFACKNGGDDPKPGGTTDVGTYAGNIQVSDDPTTKVGYVYNAKVKVTTSGSNATVKITGDNGFDREYTGTYTSQLAGYYDITLNKQTKPSEKIADARTIIINNKLTVTVDIANESVTARANPTTTETIQVSGKIKMIGTDMLKE